MIEISIDSITCNCPQCRALRDQQALYGAARRIAEAARRKVAGTVPPLTIDQRNALVKPAVDLLSLLGIMPTDVVQRAAEAGVMGDYFELLRAGAPGGDLRLVAAAAAAMEVGRAVMMMVADVVNGRYGERFPNQAMAVDAYLRNNPAPVTTSTETPQ